VTERADLVLAAFLVLTAVALATLIGALAAIGFRGLTGVAAVGAGLASACVLLAAELRQLPVGLLVVAAAAVASAVAFAFAARAMWREQRLIRALPIVPLAHSDYGDALPGVDDAGIYVLPSRRQRALCVGVLRPRIVVTSGLLEVLDDDERTAVVAHERSHVDARAPLKLALVRLVARTLFWAPVLRDLGARYVLLSELAADRAATEATSPAALAGALSQALTTPALAGSAGFADHAGARIDRLFDERARLPRIVTPVHAGATAAALAIVAALAVSSPRPSAGASARLHARLGNALAHHLEARLIGLAITLVVAALAFAAVRRLAQRPRPAHRGAARAVARSRA
jgi:Zn-dependent protease with chaperone function